MSAIIGISGIIGALYFVLKHEAEKFTGFFDLPSIVLLGIVPPCVMLLSHSIGDFVVGVDTLFRAMFGKQSRSQNEIINYLTQASALTRSQGLGALVNTKAGVRYDLLRDGISLIINNFTAEEIRHNLMAKINTKQTKMALAGNLFENLAKLSPGTGMLGTLLGLINMMSNLSDPSKIGGGMALALITTLYGLILGNFVYGPCAENISLETEKSLEMDLMVVEGILGLKGKKSSVHMRDIMKTYGGKGGAKNSPEQNRVAR